jgi:DNA-binding XRE family transcriptional regulator
MIIVCKLEEILKDRGLKKGWLADRIGVSPATLSNWINKGVIPELPLAYKTAVELDLNVMEIWRIK